MSKDPRLAIRLGDWRELGEAAYAIRLQVFVREQGVPLHMEQDEFDASAIHALAAIDGEPVGTARLLTRNSHVASIGRVAVMAQWRRQGIGLALMGALVDHARALGMETVELHAQLSAADFYTRQGFVSMGDVFVEAGIPHVSMCCDLGRLPRVDRDVTKNVSGCQ